MPAARRNSCCAAPAVAGAPRIGDAESGAVAAAFTPLTSVVSGGLACIAGALILARLLPAFRRQTAPATHPDPAPAVESARTDAERDRTAGPAATLGPPSAA